ncbi:serine hydrolase domain-containing protein [Vreelandella nigrificans]|uniref:6-aminohexanoate hydrolase n=1 Tax=Vreelandella nigrificans TaxID=2042704 RepID=A0A2A4HNA3_9GAMM|nr:serine hydrolase [Halomonas nigrificans]PCF95611.1 6-aminohexanoate hydrolase [Halomonas nigrificans]
MSRLCCRFAQTLTLALPALLLGSLLLGWTVPVVAAEPGTGVLSAEESDPNRLGWMQGFPPAPEQVIGQPDSNYFSFPKMRWTVCHFRELLPTKQVSRGLGEPMPLAYALDDAINDIAFTPIDGDEPMSWQASLNENYTDGLLILHQGQVVYEVYSGCLDEAGQHGAMSVTKSMTGLLGEVLVAEGVLDEQALVGDILPELADSAFGNATVKQLLEMTTGLAYSEDYSDPNAEIWAYNAAASPLPKPEDYTGPRTYYEYLATVQPQGEHGQMFGYKTINTDALGWVIARTTGESVASLLSSRLWRHMGAEQDAYFTVDSIGTPFAGGGLSAGLRDMARVGQLVLNEGVINGERLFPAAAVERIRQGGDKQAFAAAGYRYLPGGSYRGMWWSLHNEHGAFAARGVHGQTIYIDPTAEMVIVRFASHPVAGNAANDPTSLPAYQAVAEYLLNRSPGY